MLELADVFEQCGPAYVNKYGDRMPKRHFQVMRDIMRCHTPAIFAACAAARLTKGALLRLDEQPAETDSAKAQASARRRAVRRSDKKSGSVATVHMPKVRPPHAGSRCPGACPPCESGRLRCEYIALWGRASKFVFWH